MSSVQEKMGVILDKVAALGICGDEAKNVRSANRDWLQSQRAYGAAVKNTTAAGVSAGGGAVAILACIGPQATLCIVGGSLAVIGGLFWADSGLEAQDLAEEEMEDALDELSDALDGLCRCIAKSL
jgi:hypothetical protein